MIIVRVLPCAATACVMLDGVRTKLRKQGRCSCQGGALGKVASAAPARHNVVRGSATAANPSWSMCAQTCGQSFHSSHPHHDPHGNDKTQKDREVNQWCGQNAHGVAPAHNHDQWKEKGIKLNSRWCLCWLGTSLRMHGSFLLAACGDRRTVSTTGDNIKVLQAEPNSDGIGGIACNEERDSRGLS